MTSYKDHMIADCHCDTICCFDHRGYRFDARNFGCHVDLPRLVSGRVRLIFFAVCVADKIAEPIQLQEALRYIMRYRSVIRQNKAILCAVEATADLNQAEKEGSIACLLALEGAEPLDESLDLLELFFQLGVRSVSLTWNKRNRFADGCAEEVSGGGLTRSGRQLVLKLSAKNMIIDLAHLAGRGFYDVLEIYAGPPLVSHTNVRALCEHQRNLTDAQLKAVASKGGVVGLSFYPLFVAGKEKATLDQLVDHFVYAASLIGIDHLAIGSDFDGITTPVDQLSDASCYSVLLEALYRRGFQKDEIDALSFGNVRRLLNFVLAGGE